MTYNYMDDPHGECAVIFTWRVSDVASKWWLTLLHR